jgi:quercetin dioxygenase-like cupin family protein
MCVPHVVQRGEIHMASLNRRSALFLGAALVPVGLSREASAASMYAADAGKAVDGVPGVREIDLGKWEISIGPYKRAKVTDYLFAPGSGFPDEAMKNDLVCQILEGEIWVKQGDRSYTAKAGHVFACGINTFEEDKNQSSAPAVMRVMNLFSA